MYRTSINIKPILPMRRDTAAAIAAVASRYDSTITFETENVILNAKSMLGLLSMTLPEDGQVMLTSSGKDEENAAQALLNQLDLLFQKEC
ncbi:MAG: HPr family phosphocarrier protein [Clostridiales bacterium]|nr:HPr family phosphocarrier protein [Clostridiales bacterium]